MDDRDVKKKKNQTNKGTYNDVKRRPEYIENTQGNKSNSCYVDKQQHNIEDFIQLPVKAQVGFFSSKNPEISSNWP